MPRKYGISVDLNVKEGHDGYNALSKCPPCIGYKEFVSAERKRFSPQSHGTSGTSQDALVAKRQAQAMAIATKPGQQILMNAFMMYMSGNNLNIFTISTTSMAILTPLTSILKVERTFEKLEVDTQMAKLVFLALNLLWLGIGMYKMSSMRLLPTTSADWADSIVWKDMMETSSIPPVM